MVVLPTLLSSLLLFTGTTSGQDAVHPESRTRATRQKMNDRPVHRMGDGEYQVNLEEFATEIVRGKANLSIVGDSINNFGQWNWMYTGYLLNWQPRNWRQIHTSVASGGIPVGAWVEYSGSAQYPLLLPGKDVSGLEELAGTNTWTIRVLQTPQGQGAWSGKAIAAGFRAESFQYESGMLRDADGGGRMLRTDGLYRHRAMIIADDSTGYRSRFQVRVRNSAAGTDWQQSEQNVQFEVDSDPRLVWHDSVLTGSVEGLGNTGSGLYTPFNDPLPLDERVGLGGTILTDLGLETGLGLAYIGQGGWLTGNHRYPHGHPDVPVIGPIGATYPGSYSDHALQRHFLAHETSHAMLWIGTNNGGIDGSAPWRPVEDVAAILERYRISHAQARSEDPSLPEIRFLIVAPYASYEGDFFPAYAAGLRDLAGDDVAFIDLHQIVLDERGTWSEWEMDLLVDGVHPNLEGCKFFASRIWRELINAAGPTADLNRDGVVDGADFGLLLGQWGCEDPGYADLTGDGCVTGSDIGIMLGQWTIGSGG